MGDKDPRRERAEQDKNLEKAKMNVHIREQVEKNGPIQPHPKPGDKGEKPAGQ